MTCLLWILILLAVLAGVWLMIRSRWDFILSLPVPAGRAGGPLPLAVVELPYGGGILVVWILIAAVVIAVAMRKTRSNEMQRSRALKTWVRDMRDSVRRDAELRWGVSGSGDPDTLNGLAARDTMGDDPLAAELRCLIGPPDAVAILQTCEMVLCQAEEKLTRQTTREGLGVEVYDEALHLAVQDVRSVKYCLAALRDKMEAGTPDPDTLLRSREANREQRTTEGVLP